MANEISVNVYQVNNQNAVPLNKVTKWGFPVAGILTRSVSDQNGNPWVVTATGIYCYGQIIYTDGGITALVVETQAALATLAG